MEIEFRKKMERKIERESGTRTWSEKTMRKLRDNGLCR